MKEKEKNKNEFKEDGKYVSMGGCFVWKGPLPPRPNFIPPANSPKSK